MIGYLRGKVLHRMEGGIVVECGGVGYEVVLPAYLVDAGIREGEEVALYISYQVSPNQPKPMLVGFRTWVEREFFERFITVDGLGPARAVRAMVYPVHEIADAIERRDVGFLRQLPGLGARTAEKVVAALHGKMGKFALLRTEVQAAPVEVDFREEVLEILTKQLGHRPAEARRMVEAALRRNPAVRSAEELFQEVYRVQREAGS
ncbi:MAG: Holliday junction branch migration protein RuvA [Armatimonadota bacterium]|nr:Holliday junction branch migration protein RuvA [Armatimonadota bacterium]MDR7438680.1 Holliday junction branch migration protein RuvA [Armatimonadota bacterium]MDR7563777.1 Holliday junction branch migration protein RuvA [Armatimonadota bacterium]MDR7568787.1 Holliday junction branch migration protein RuvA [Armatimonadota bacterium]MDR7601803.1 Holliday junction branch migration protein RuvA [Armatimonadota bacterium]